MGFWSFACCCSLQPPRAAPRFPGSSLAERTDHHHLSVSQHGRPDQTVPQGAACCLHLHVRTAFRGTLTPVWSTPVPLPLGLNEGTGPDEKSLEMETDCCPVVEHLLNMHKVFPCTTYTKVPKGRDSKFKIGSPRMLGGCGWTFWSLYPHLSPLLSYSGIF